ncbi:205_t:CDS:2, partial [Ambispora leptoticha]
VDSAIPHNSDTAHKVPPLPSYQIVTANFCSKVSSSDSSDEEKKEELEDEDDSFYD